jgi:hypothetical protein
VIWRPAIGNSGVIVIFYLQVQLPRNFESQRANPEDRAFVGQAGTRAALLCRSEQRKDSTLRCFETQIMAKWSDLSIFQPSIVQNESWWKQNINEDEKIDKTWWHLNAWLLINVDHTQNLLH